MKKLLILIVLIFSTTTAYAQFGNQNDDEEWDAEWVAVPEAGETDAGLYLFRKTINLDSAPGEFNVRVSADNKYKLYVNGSLVALGPAVGDIENWNYDSIDLAPHLEQGENIIAAEVWNEGDRRPVMQFSYRTGFLLQGTSDETKVLNTDDSWKSIEDESYTAISQSVRGYYAAGPGERIDMNQKIKGWKELSFDDSNWESAEPVFEQSESGFGFNTRGGWELIPSIVPQMELSTQRLATTRRAEGVDVPSSFPAEKSPVTIPANTTATILLDQSVLTNAYPTLIFSDGDDATIVITYAEALFDEEGEKHNRNIIEGKTISGRQDTVLSDGSQNQNFTTLSWRTYRYLQLEVQTGDDPMVIEDIYGTFTGYPFEMNASLETNNDEINEMMDIGWRTARLCAVDTYMDCPYYERLQYIGDTRIQMMISYYNSGDDRLAKYGIELFDNSRQPNGHTLSRYPDTQGQVIPTYSLWHVSVLHDYLMHGKDQEFVATKLLGTRQIMNYFISYVQEDGSLKNVPGWNFTDWVPEWNFGTAPAAEDGSSALLDLQLLYALQSAESLEKHEGSEEFARLYGTLAGQMENTIQEKYWDESRGIYADTPQKDRFSQHANSLAILTGLAEGETAEEIAETMVSDTTLAPASIYFKYYLHLALAEAGMGDDYLEWLDIWRKNIDLGLTTWGETSQVETTRSDSHAWGSSPNIEFFRIILGIESDGPYFSQVKIEPNLGDIEEISGEMPHPNGTISVNYRNSDDGLSAEINLPQDVSGTFVWEGESHDLAGGDNNLEL